MKKRKPTLSPFAQLQRQADIRRGDGEDAIVALYQSHREAREAFHQSPTPEKYLDVLTTGQAYWSAVKATPEYPKGAEPSDE